MASVNDIPSDPAGLGDEIARVAAHLDAATHRLLTCIRAFDESEEWGHQGALNCAHWLTWRLRLGPVAAREKVRVARALGNLPLIDDGLRRGVLSYAQVRALTRVAAPENEERLLAMAQATTGAQLERLCRSLRRAIATEDGFRPDELRTFREDVLENGMVRLTLVVHADEAAVVMKAIDLARRSATQEATSSASAAASAESASGDVSEASRPHPSPARPTSDSSEARPAVGPSMAESVVPLISRADAVVKLAEAYLTHGDAAGSGGQRTQIVVHLDQDPLADDHILAATLDDGTRLSAETFRRLSCDATVVPARHSSNDPQLDLGRRTRTVSPALRRALALRDRGCRYPACTNHFFLHAHHIVHWAHGGATSLANLVTLCGAHHRLLHEGGFQVQIGDEGQLLFADQRGKPVQAVPLAPDLDGDGTDVVTGWNERAGLAIDAGTGFPGWDGELIDYSWTVDAVFAGGEQGQQ
jgi:hypothetical protein